MARPSDIKKKKLETTVDTYVPPEDPQNIEKAVKILSDNGYNAIAMDGVVLVTIPGNGDSTRLSEELLNVTNIISSVGFNGSYGVRYKRSE